MDFCSSCNSNSIFNSFQSLEMAPYAFIFESNIDRESLLRVVSVDVKQGITPPICMYPYAEFYKIFTIRGNMYFINP